MEKYVLVLEGDKPGTEGCNYLAMVDKDGPRFTYDIDDAIQFNDLYCCVQLARSMKLFKPLDVYSVKEMFVRAYEFIW